MPDKGMQYGRNEKLVSSTMFKATDIMLQKIVIDLSESQEQCERYVKRILFKSVPGVNVVG
jgi:hypothetical protein